MNDATFSFLPDTIGLSLIRLMACAQERLTVVAPFVKQEPLERLLAGLPPALPLTVFTRWRLDEIVSGASDLGVLDMVQARPDSRLLLHPFLHAKLLLVDDAVAVFGSANISDSALAFRTPSNVELMAEVRPVPNAVFLFLRQLERSSVAGTEEMRRRLELAAATVVPPTRPDTDDPPVGNPIPTSPFPSFRSPDRLYEGYLSVRGVRDPETRAAILDDLSDLRLPDGLDEASFRERVGQALLSRPDVAAFDSLVEQPRYFGEMADWLKSRGVLADWGQEDRKRYLQTLIRWLRYFLPGRYRLEEPNYSELFGRADSWRLR